MEGLNPNYLAILETEWALLTGQSHLKGLRQHLRMNSEGSWSPALRRICEEGALRYRENSLEGRTACFFQQVFVGLLCRAEKGEPIAKALAELRCEYADYCDDQIKAFVQKLPLRALVPVMFLMVPAYLILLFLPFLSSLAHMGVGV